jgi:oligoendopeptidase F
MDTAKLLFKNIFFYKLKTMYKLSDFIPSTLKINSWEDLKPYFEKLQGMNPASVTELENFILKYSDVMSVYREQDARAYIDMTCFTDNETFLKRHEIFNTEISPQVQIVSNEIDKKISASPHYANLGMSRYGNFKRSLERELKLFREENVALEAELSQLNTKYSQITGALTANIQGKDLPLPQASVFLTQSDRAVRKEAWLAIQESRYAVREQLETLYTQMVGLRHKVAQNAGYANYRDYKHDALERFDYTVQDVFAFHKAVKECVIPLAEKITERHAEKLGLVNDYRPWDTQGQPAGQEPLKPFTTGQELLQKTITVFSKLDPQFGENLKRMEATKLFDLESRKGKAPGGYNYGLEVTGMPFIFMNAAGLHRDMVTLMHEGGHAMHTFLTNSEPLIFYRDTPSEMAETASMSMELMTSPSWGAFYQGKDLARARREHLEDIVTFFPWCATVDKFQHWVYENPAHTEEQRSHRFEEVYAEYGKSLLNWQGYEHYRRTGWHRQLHVFEVPFYYIEYGIAQLGALQVYRNFVRDPKKALAGYVSGLKLGSSKPIPEIWDAMGIRFDFSVAMIRDLMGFIQEELGKIKEK